MVPILKASRQPPDNLDDYKQEFGFLGPALQASVTRARAQGTTASISSSGSLSTTAGGNLALAGTRNTLTVSAASSFAAVAARGQATVAASNQTKYVFVTSRPSTPVQVIVITSFIHLLFAFMFSL